MFTTVLLTLFTHSILKNEIQCAVIGRENLNKISRNLPDLTENLTMLKKTENLEPQNEFVTQFESKNKTKRNDKSIELDGVELSKFSASKEGVNIPISSRKNLSESNVRGRQPKFFGSLAFLAGLGAGGLATAASDNVNTIVKLLNGPLPVPFGFSRYYTGFYAPPPYLPVSYPVLYPVPSLANNYQNFGNPIPVLSSPIPVAVPAPVRQNTINNNTAGISRQNSNTNLVNVTENKEPDDGELHGNQEVAATQAKLKITAAPEKIDDICQFVEDVSPVVSEESELRQLMKPSDTIFSTSTTTTMEIPQPTSTITTNSTTMDSTEGSNDTVASTPSTNTSAYFPFEGYFGGSPQVVNNVMFTTEDPHQRYLKGYSADSYALPFERPAVFNPYQNVDTYSSPFVNSFSAGEPYPEFLNTVESNRYLYDTENRQNYNGFRPILK